MTEVRAGRIDLDELLQPVDPPDGHDCADHEPDGPQPREATAAARGWGEGWPTDNSSKMTVVRAGGIALSVRNELAGLIEWLVNETTARGYALRHGECWGFCNRPIRGTKRPSNHSWGLAVDLNSRTNPMQATLKTDMPSWMVELWTARQFRWGGSYQRRKDAMHFEFMGTPADAARLTTELGVAAPPAAQSPQAAARPLLKRGAKGPDVVHLQERLNAHGASLKADGDFGPATEAAVRAFQGAKQLVADGIVGPKTWAALG